jgi:hypothetical protein
MKEIVADTTVKYYNEVRVNLPVLYAFLLPQGENLAFIITGVSYLHPI